MAKEEEKKGSATRSKKKVSLITARQAGTMTQVESNLYLWLDKTYPASDVRSLEDWKNEFIKQEILED